jgi:hypothetical protein
MKRTLLAKNAARYKHGTLEKSGIAVYWPDDEENGTAIIDGSEYLPSDFVRLRNSLVPKNAAECEIVFDTH